MIKPKLRPLTDEERASLEYLLTDDVPDVAFLRAQAGTAVVSGRCDCGCATIDLVIADSAPNWKPDAPMDRIVALAFSRRHAKRALLELHQIGGRITELEIVDLDASGPQAIFPPLETWEPPIVGPGPDSYSGPEDPV